MEKEELKALEPRLKEIAKQLVEISKETGLWLEVSLYDSPYSKSATFYRKNDEGKYKMVASAFDLTAEEDCFWAFYEDEKK